MFNISINDIKLCHEEMEEQIIKHKQVIVEAENIIRKMSDVEGINHFKERLRCQIKGLEEQQVKYRKLTNTLEVIAMNYYECDQKNIETMEMGSPWKLTVSFKQNDFTNITNQLGEIKLGGL